MRKAIIYVNGNKAGRLVEEKINEAYYFTYDDQYKGPPVSLTLPVKKDPYQFIQFPPFLDGLLPEGIQLEGLLRHAKIGRGNYFSQLMAVGGDLVGALTVVEEK